MKSRPILSGFCSIGLGISAALGTVSESRADQAALTHSGSWEYDLSGYGFLPFSTEGSSTVAGATIPLDLDFQDALDVLDLAFAGRFEAWRGDLGLIVDLNYFALKVNAQPAPPIAADVNVKQAWLYTAHLARCASAMRALPSDVLGPVERPP